MALLKTYKYRCRNVLFIALIIIIGFLVYCKISSSPLASILSHINPPRILPVLVPLGISYYTFSSVAYLLDIYWRKTKAEMNYPKLLLCMIYFPHIVEGPISRYDRLLPQLTELTRPAYKQLCFGLQLMVWGYFKKMVVADRLAIFVNTIFGAVQNYQGFEILIASIFGVFQIYADFSGCMDIVCGASEILGIKLDQNFNHPFFSKSIAEFWRRWHITLGTWFKDYVYFPIATSPRLMKLTAKIKEKKGNEIAKNISVIIPLMTVWLLTGLWHGTGLNYIFWGIYFGLIITTSTIFAKNYQHIVQKMNINTEGKGWAFFQMVRTFILFLISRLIVLPGSFRGFIRAVRQLFASFNIWVLFDGSLYNKGLNQPNFIIGVLGIFALLIIDFLQEKCCIRESIVKMNIIVRWTIYYVAIFSIIIFGIYGSSYTASSFIYGNF